MPSQLSNYIRGVGSGYAKIFVTLLIGLWMVPFSLRFLTAAEYGLFAIAADLMLWLGLLQLGTGAALSSRAAQMVGSGDRRFLSELSSTALVIQLVAALVVVIVGGALALNLHRLFFIDGNAETLRLVLFLLVLGAAVQVSAQVFSGLLIAAKKIHVDNLLGIAAAALQAVITAVLLLLGLKLMALAIASLVSIAAMAAIAYWRVRRSLPEVEISLANVRMAHVRDLLGNGVWFTVGGLAGLLILNLDRFIVGRYVSLEIVTAFVITGKLYFIADRLHAQIFNVLRPYFGQLYGKRAVGALCMLYQSAFIGSLLLAGLMGVAVFSINKYFVSAWVGDEYYLGDLVSLLFALNFVLQASVLPNRVLLASSLYRMKWNSGARLFEGSLNLLLSLALVGSEGIEGVLIASIIGSVTCSAIALNYLARDFFRTQSERPSPGIYLSYFVVPVLLLAYYLEGVAAALSAVPAAVLAVILVWFTWRHKFVRDWFFKAARSQ